MTKEEKILWATWMASTDIGNYAVDIVLDFSQMMDCELDRIWDEGLHLKLNFGKEGVAYPCKSYNPPKSMVWIRSPEGKFIKVAFAKNDEIASQKEQNEWIVAELKRIGFTAPWVDEREVKRILVATWGKNWKAD